MVRKSKEESRERVRITGTRTNKGIKESEPLQTDNLFVVHLKISTVSYMRSQMN